MSFGVGEEIVGAKLNLFDWHSSDGLHTVIVDPSPKVWPKDRAYVNATTFASMHAKRELYTVYIHIPCRVADRTG